MTDGTRLAAFRSLRGKLTEAQHLAGMVEADSGPSEGADFLETMRGILSAFAEWAELSGNLIEHERTIGSLVDDYPDRPDLRVDFCTGCGIQTNHRYVRGEWVCVIDGTVLFMPRRSLAVVRDDDARRDAQFAAGAILADWRDKHGIGGVV